MGHQRSKVARAEAIWPTRSSSTKRHDCLSNIFLRGNCRNYRPIRWVGKAKVFWGRRVLFLQGPKSISILWCQTLCRCQLPNCSTHFPLGKFGRYSSLQSLIPSTDPISPPRSDSYGGRSVPSINRATCCLTSVEIKRDLSHSAGLTRAPQTPITKG